MHSRSVIIAWTTCSSIYRVAIQWGLLVEFSCNSHLISYWEIYYLVWLLIFVTSGCHNITVDLFNLHPPMVLNAHSFGFHMVSCKYIPSYAIFYDYVEQFHDATWVGVNSKWIIHIPSCSPILDVSTFEQCNLSSHTNQFQTSTLVNPFLVKFNRPTCRTQEIASLPTLQQLGRILHI